MKNFIQKLTIMGALVLCVASHANAAPSDGERQAFAHKLMTYVNNSNINGCQVLTEAAHFLKIAPCLSCSNTETGLEACVKKLVEEITDETLPMACPLCTQQACQKEGVKKACEIFCCPSYSSTIKECIDCSLPSAK